MSVCYEMNGLGLELGLNEYIVSNVLLLLYVDSVIVYAASFTE